ncbi:MAG TPA: hypothetical protein VGO33_03645 [Gemmatimonadaceae bacterium]|nr:hypothetical protein [Gemmatimonadaceae bacterium]
MILEQRSRILPTALRRPALYLLAASLLLLAFTPLTEFQFGADARPHVEVAGTSAHHAHNPADCAACAARSLLVVANHSAQAGIESSRTALPGLPPRDERPDFLRESSSRSRAPPLRQA